MGGVPSRFYDRSMIEERAKRLSKIGGWVSVACAIHCMIGPVLIGLLPVIGARGELAETLEGPLILVSVLIGVTAILAGYREHHRRATLLLLAFSLAALAGGKFLALARFESPLIVGGAALMAIGQFMNLRLQRNCCRRHAETSRGDREHPVGRGAAGSQPAGRATAG